MWKTVVPHRFMTFRVHTRFYVCFGRDGNRVGYIPLRVSWDTHPFEYSPETRRTIRGNRVGGRTISHNNNNNNGSRSGGIATSTCNVCQYTAAVDVAVANNVIYFVFGDISIFVYQFVFCIQFSFSNRIPRRPKREGTAKP